MFAVLWVTNRPWFITKWSEKQLESVLVVGTPKEEIISFLRRNDRPAIDYSSLEGECQERSYGEFTWRCQYPSLVATGWQVETISLAERHINVAFVFDESETLIRHYMAISYTFL